MSIKPVAWMRTGAEKSDGPFGHYGPVKLYSDDVPLYHIPDTHRVVSVELLERLLQENYLHPDEGSACIELVAIIEKKP